MGGVMLTLEFKYSVMSAFGHTYGLSIQQVKTTKL